MERTSRTSVYFYESTRRHITEGSHLHIRRREKLKCHQVSEDLEGGNNGLFQVLFMHSLRQTGENNNVSQSV
jgi:hypothetical protein